MKNVSVLSSKITSYSAVAAALLAGKSATSQIIYHDIKPDADLLYNSSPVELDLNGDGKIDVTFHMKTFMDSGYLVYNGMEASPERGVSFALNPSRYGVAALDPNAKIGKKLNTAYSWGINSRLAYQYSSEFGIMHTTAGPWNYKQDKNRYVGFRILKGGHEYYGWIRCKVDFSLFNTKAAELIVKDYAYNSTPDQLIRAGQETADFSAEKNDAEGNLLSNPLVYSSGKMIYVQDNENEIGSGTITIYNLLGEKVYDQQVSTPELRVDLRDQLAGLYIVNLQNPRARKSFRVALH